jgi:hypothetical protein
VQFHITYQVTSEHRDEVQALFKKTGARPPESVTMKGRWHSINGDEGYIIAETSKSEAMGKWIQEWSDKLSFKVVPVLTDEEVAKIIG